MLHKAENLFLITNPLFYIKDHLGDNRIVADQSGKIVQSTQYYPFGMAFADGSGEAKQPYKYNGKELDNMLGPNTCDYEARNMDPATGRFTKIDLRYCQNYKPEGILLNLRLFSYICKKDNMKSMLPNQRREKIMELIREDGHAKVQDLARIFKVTEVTIRQDLEKLEAEGLVVREHGGAILSNACNNVKDITLQNQSNMPAKIAIARKALEYINDGDTIILDSGSTTTEIAKLITAGYKDLTVITNALNIALIVGVNPGVNLIVTGGEFKPPTLSLTGQKAADFFNNLNADKLFLATAGISLKAGLTYPSISDLCVKRAMIEVSDKVYLVADSTKIGIKSFASLGALALIDHLITDSQITKENVKMLEEHEIDCITADI